MKLPKNYNRLTRVINSAEKAMLDSMLDDMYDDEFHYVMSRLLLKISHIICKAFPLPKDDDE